MKRLLPLSLVLLLAACAGAPKKPSQTAPAGASVPGASAGTRPAPGCTGASPYAPAQEDPSTRGHYTAGGLYRPGVRDSTPDYVPNVDCIPEPAVVHEPRSRYGNRSPYQVLGRSYHVLDDHQGFVETGLASYYGNKFHGRLTSNQEVYDMYAFTAAHKSLPLPSFARVTNLDNGRSVVVRVNDRGPFHEGRVVDLSYAAAVKLGIHPRGTGRVEVRALSPGDGLGPQLAVAPTPSAASGIDAWVQAPAAAAPVMVATAAPVAAPALPAGQQEENRFRMMEGGRVRSADEFDAWMAERQQRYDAWQRQHGGAAASASSPGPAAATAPAAAGSSAPGTLLQVGVFSVRANAENALARLRAAGIGSAMLHDGHAGGRPVWRLRVGPVDAGRIGELSSRVAGLGFGAPQIVRD